jgi:hypothetical protein
MLKRSMFERCVGREGLRSRCFTRLARKWIDQAILRSAGLDTTPSASISQALRSSLT